MTLQILSFNNYYNRRVKIANSTENLAVVHVINDVNFNPNDGISTDHIIGANTFYDGSGDYAILLDNAGNIVSRWWLVEQTRTRNGQYHVILKRDVIADYYDVILNSPCFIEKASLNIDNPLIFNKEDMGYNQIKTSETLIKDKSNVPWIVFYLDRSATGAQTFTVPASEVVVNGEYDSVDAYPYYTYSNLDPQASKFYGNYTNLTFGLNNAVLMSTGTSVSANHYRYTWNSGLTWIARENGSARNYVQTTSTQAEIIDTIRTVGSRYSNWYNLSYDYTKANNAIAVENLLEENNKIYYINGTYYKITVEQNNAFTETVEVDRTSGLGIYFEAIKNSLKNTILSTSTGSPYDIRYTVPTYSVIMTEISFDTFTLNIPQSRTHCTNTPYDVLCIPAGYIVKSTPEIDYSFYSDIAFKMAAELGKKSNEQIFDIQLLPYAPLSDEIFESYGDYSVMTPEAAYSEGTDYFYITDSNDNAISVCFSIQSNKLRKFIEGPVIKAADTALERKVNSECDMYRLCSPNYDGAFEFSAEKNFGVSSWTVDLTYKPYSPYICVAPMFDNLYGRDFGDSRGLVCGGEFSLPRATSAWENYELNNKNFQKSFDRQIENLEFNQRIEMGKAITAAAVGTVQGAASGAFIGSMLPVSKTGLGAGIGAAASAAGGVADIWLMAEQQKETLDYTKDLFGYELGNIKARPNTLNKIGAFDITNKVFPFVEYYTATDVEKEALRNKIKYNGMTVMTIGTINEYIQPEETYIKGSLIRCEGIDDDYHLVLSIAEELNKGVYI